MTDSRIQQLIDKFWAGEASDQERRILLDYLDKHHLDLKAVLARDYGKEGRSAHDQEIEPSQAEAWLRNIHAVAGMDEQNEHRPQPLLRFRWIAAAAMVVLTIGALTALFLNPFKDAAQHPQVAYHTAPVTHHNTTGEARQLLLPDSSVVVLSPQSKLSYSPAYGVKVRGVRLQGEARFTVRPDKEKPFTVYANGFATTALGTEFVVSTRKAGHTTVKLLSGKVVVTSTAQSNFTMAATYLVPGDELHIDALEETASVVHTTRPPLPRDKPTALARAADGNEAGLHFSRTPLAEVFRRIAGLKGVSISVSGADLDELSFSGQLLPTDSLETILSIVCTMNDLDYRYENNRIVITNK